MPTVSDSFRCRETDASGACTRFHYGTDFIGFSAVRAVSAGVVLGVGVLSGWSAGGTQVHIGHEDGYQSRSLHLVTGSTTVVAGQRVSAGQVIGTMGNTGASQGVHLHLEIHAPSAVDPVPFLSARISGGPIPPGPDPIPQLEAVMIRISAPNRGVALIGPGYYRHLATTEEVQQSEVLVTKDLSGNDRQFDLWSSMALHGQATGH